MNEDKESIFLTAEWRKLAMANYAVDPQILKPFVPKRTELDLYNGICYVSLVGFLFQHTRVKGMAIPAHEDFEEVNLRFYVRYKDGDIWKRGVVFIKEIVPKMMISFVANLVYKEPYQTMPMRHHLRENTHLEVGYEWECKEFWNRFHVVAEKQSRLIAPETEEDFITQHFWGYTKMNEKETKEYEVEHPRWEHYPIRSYQIDVKFGDVYGDSFKELENNAPRSVLLAEGSEISVRDGVYV